MMMMMMMMMMQEEKQVLAVTTGHHPLFAFVTKKDHTNNYCTLSLEVRW